MLQYGKMMISHMHCNRDSNVRKGLKLYYRINKIDVGISQNSVIDDIGSGTGILTQKLLEKGSKVYGIDPMLICVLLLRLI